MNPRIIALASLLLAGASRADEMENAPGSLCVGTNQTLTVNTQGQTENRTTSTVTAVCPTERRTINSSFPTQFSATVWVNDQHSTQNVCCRVVSRLPNGATTEGLQSCSSAVGSATLSLSAITETYTFAHFFVRCVVPPVEAGKTSAILTFRSTQS